MVIIGNGFIGSKLRSHCFLNDGVIYARGASNGLELNDEEKARDFRLLKAELERYQRKRFFYISTCSVHDIHQRYFSTYVRHKLNLERMVTNNQNSYVVRLPNLVGRNQNPNNLFSYFVRNLSQKIPIEIWRGAYRNFLNSDDLGRFLDIIFMNINKTSPRHIDIASPRAHSVEFFFDLVHAHVQTKPELIVKNFGSRYHIPAYWFWRQLPANDPLRENDYLKRSISEIFSGA